MRPQLVTIILLAVATTTGHAATIGSWQELRAAVSELADDDVATRLSAAMFLWSEGDEDRARIYLREILALDPAHAVARRLLEDEARSAPAPGSAVSEEKQPKPRGRGATDTEPVPHSPEWYRAQGYRQHRGQWLREHEFRRVVAREQRVREELRQRADWDNAWDFESRYFRIKTNCSHQVAQEIGHALDLCYETLAHQVFNLTKQQPKVPVEVYATQEQFMKASLRSGFSVGFGTLGYYHFGGGRAGIRCFYAGSIEQTLSTLFHECTHLVINQIVGDRVPTWSNEGLAVFFEDAERRQREIDLRAVPWGRLWHLHDQLRRDDISLDRLVSIEIGYTAEYYPQGWALIHFMLFANDGRYRKRFMAYYDLLRQQDYRSNMAAFHRIFGQRPDAFYPEWKAYILALEPTTATELAAAAQEAASSRYDFERASGYAERAMELAPEEGDVLVGCGRTWLYQALLESSPAVRRKLALRAAEALAAGIAAKDWGELKPQRDTSIHLPLLVHIDRARALIAAGEWTEAREVLYGILEIDPFSSEASAYLALIAGTSDDPGLRNGRIADEHLAMADDIGKTHVNLYVRACLAHERGQTAHAIELLHQAADLDRSGLYRRQALLLRHGDRNRPRAILREGDR